MLFRVTLVRTTHPAGIFPTILTLYSVLKLKKYDRSVPAITCKKHSKSFLVIRERERRGERENKENLIITYHQQFNRNRNFEFVFETLINVNFHNVQNHHTDSRNDDGNIVGLGYVFKDCFVGLKERHREIYTFKFNGFKTKKSAVNHMNAHT